MSVPLPHVHSSVGREVAELDGTDSVVLYLDTCSPSSRDGLSCGWDREGSGLAPVQHLAPQHPSRVAGLMLSSLSQGSELCGIGLDPSAPVL